MSKERVGYHSFTWLHKSLFSMGATHVDAGKEKKSVEICEELLKRYREEGDQFLLNIVTGYESWIYHFDPEEKRLSMQYRHIIDSPEKIQNSAVCRQDYLTVFWDSQRVYMTEFLEAGNTVNSARYIETIKKTYGGGCDELGGQHRRFCCCMTMQDRTLLAQRLMLWRR